MTRDEENAEVLNALLASVFIQTLLLVRFRLGIRKDFFTEGVVKHWTRLFTKVVESPSLEISKRGVDVLRHCLVVDLATLC